MLATYDTLFSIQLMHEYFLNGKCEDIEVVPTEDCKAVSRKMDIQWRKIENQLIGLIKKNDVNEPFINIPPDKSFHKYFDRTVFRFYVKLKNPLFFNYTNIDFSYTSGKKFYFNNLANNRENGMLFLTTPIKEYVAGATYLPGNLVKDPANGSVYEAIVKTSSRKKNQLSDVSVWAPKGLLHLSKHLNDHSISKTYLPGDLALKQGTDQVFEAVKKHISRNSAELDDTSIWSSRGNGQLQYVTDNDTIEYCSNHYIFKVSAPVTTAEISISGFNYNNASPAMDLPMSEKEVRTFKEPTKQISVNLSVLNAGRYEIKINNEIKTVYFDPSLNAGEILGVIEIFNHLDGTNDYALLDKDEKIKKVTYNIQFANRRVLWRYKPKDGKAESITDVGDTGYAFKLNGSTFVSTTPIPLSQSVLKTLKLDFNTKDFSLFPLPNPNIQHLAKCTQNDYDYLCSDVYLNY